MSRMTPPVHWGEGMFLTPQHLQGFTRHLDGRLGHVALGSMPFGWGIEQLDLDRQALENLEFKVRRLEVTLDDGLYVRIPDECEVPVRNLASAFPQGNEVHTVYLAIPELMARSPNTFEEGESGDEIRRYRVRIHEEVDENSGDGARPIGYRQLNARVLLSSEDRSGYECIPIAKIVMSGGAESVLEVVPNYIPPVRRIAADSRLPRQLEDVVNALQAKARSIAEQVVERKIYWGGEGGGGDAEMLWKLHVLNGAIASLRPLVKTPELHPYHAYLEFCRLVGDLSIFARERVVPDLPPYDHLDLEGCYSVVVREAKRLLDAIIPTSFVRRPFDPQANGQQVLLEEDWISPGVTLVLGVESDLDHSEVRKKLGPIKLSAPSEMPTIQTQRLSGIPKKEITRVPAELPDREQLHYWEINCDGDHWYRAREERAICLFGPADKNAELDFSLFVIFGKGS